MGKRMSAGREVDREKNWEKIFNALVTLTKNLEKDRNFLEDRIKVLNGVVYKMKMEQKVESAKKDFFLGLKEREASVFKERYEIADNELDGVRAWFEHYSQNILAPQNASKVVSNKGEGSQNKASENEAGKLKDDEKSQSGKNMEISALLSEKNFIWNQYNKMEGDFRKRLMKKDLEIKQADEKVSLLIERVEDLQISNESLRTDHAKIQMESDQKSNEISRLLKEIEHLKSIPQSATPLLRSCLVKSSATHEKGNSSGAGRSLIEIKKEVGSSMTRKGVESSNGGRAPRTRRKILSEDRIHGSKRKPVEVNKIADESEINTPKLFTSSFKVPKLKSSSNLA